jgi:hypothetical protein
MATADPAPKRRWLKPLVWGIALLIVVPTALFWGGVAVETYVLSQRIPLLTNAKKLEVGMTQADVEDLFGVKPEDRKPPAMGRFVTPEYHEGVKRYTESRDDGPDGNSYVNYSGWYNGMFVTSQHHVSATYDSDGKLKKWH